MDIPILYENKDFVVVNKPAGLAVHSDGVSKVKTLTDWVLREYPTMSEVGELMQLSGGKTVSRPGLVHRLDKETSGVLVLAKNNTAHAYLKSQFQERNVSKTYIAFTHGVIQKDEGGIVVPIGRSKHDARARAPHGAGTQKDAHTDFLVVNRFSEYTYVNVFPKTGRTHQIRVHLKSIGHPVVCDPIYAKNYECPSPPGRLALHASKIEFNDLHNKKISVDAPIPGDLASFLAKLRSA
jgi:23S rRNA pseudouridine1911/1915/1917 synthase